MAIGNSLDKLCHTRSVAYSIKYIQKFGTIYDIVHLLEFRCRPLVWTYRLRDKLWLIAERQPNPYMLYPQHHQDRGQRDTASLWRQRDCSNDNNVHSIFSYSARPSISRAPAYTKTETHNITSTCDIPNVNKTSNTVIVSK